MSTLTAIESLKRTLRRHPPTYSVGRAIYSWLRADLRWRRYRKDAFRRRCYAKFEAGETVLDRVYGDIKVSYAAISPKNYYHLSMGSQHEDRFMPVLFDRYVRKGDVILDIGAHTGMYSIPFAKAVGESGKVYAFEPETEGYNAIARNAELNSLSNVEAMNLAVTDRDGTIDFFIRPDKDTHSIFEETSAPSPLGIQHTVAVEASSVDSLLERQVILQPDFVKIDVEGAELRVFDGMNRAAAGVRHVLLEVHHGALGSQGLDDPGGEVERKLRDLGFSDLGYLDRHHILASK